MCNSERGYAEWQAQQAVNDEAAWEASESARGEYEAQAQAMMAKDKQNELCNTCRFWDAGNWVEDLQCHCLNEFHRGGNRIFVTAPFYTCSQWELKEQLKEMDNGKS